MMTELHQPVDFTLHPNRQGQIVAVATLNAPKSLNALTLDMIDLLYQHLQAWTEDDRVVCVVIRGTGEKAFCAGGDVVQLYHSMVEAPRGPNAYAEAFFSHEYRLDYFIHTYPKPLICLGHGIVMGGGLGVFAGAQYRIVSENSRIAMPEVTIGLFPDVGGSWFLNRMPQGVGLFLGLTGAPINGTDALDVGLATHAIANRLHPELLTRLARQSWASERADIESQIQAILCDIQNNQQLTMPPANVMPLQPLLADFAKAENPASAVEEIQSYETADPWFQKARNTLAKGCPTTAHLVWLQLHEYRSLPLAEVFKHELNLAIQCTRQGEFQEGVRALLIEKDGNPQWHHKDIQSVDAAWLAEFQQALWPPEKHPLADIGTESGRVKQ